MDVLLAAISLGQSALRLLEQLEAKGQSLTPELIAQRSQVRRELVAASQMLADTLQSQLDADRG